MDDGRATPHTRGRRPPRRRPRCARDPLARGRPLGARGCRRAHRPRQLAEPRARARAGGRYDRLPVSADVLERLARNAVHLLPEGGLAEKLRQGRPLRREAGDRRHLAGHPRRAGDPAAADAGVPGRGAPRRPHHRRLHHADRRPVGPVGGAPVLSGDEIDRNARTYVEQAMIVLDPDADRGAVQRRVAREARLRRDPPAHADDDGLADPRARRLRETVLPAATRSRSPSCCTR